MMRHCLPVLFAVHQLFFQKKHVMAHPLNRPLSLPVTEALKKSIRLHDLDKFEELDWLKQRINQQVC